MNISTNLKTRKVFYRQNFFKITIEGFFFLLLISFNSVNTESLNEKRNMISNIPIVEIINFSEVFFPLTNGNTYNTTFQKYGNSLSVFYPYSIESQLIYATLFENSIVIHSFGYIAYNFSILKIEEMFLGNTIAEMNNSNLRCNIIFGYCSDNSSAYIALFKITIDPVYYFNLIEVHYFIFDFNSILFYSSLVPSTLLNDILLFDPNLEYRLEFIVDIGNINASFISIVLVGIKHRYNFY